MVKIMIAYIIVGFAILFFGSILSDTLIMGVGTIDILIGSLINDFREK